MKWITEQLILRIGGSDELTTDPTLNHDTETDGNDTRGEQETINHLDKPKEPILLVRQGHNH